MKGTLRICLSTLSCLVLLLGSDLNACGYTFHMIVPDVRQPTSQSGGSACPIRAHQLAGSGNISLRWSTALNNAPVTVITLDQTANGRLNEIESSLQKSLAVWTGVAGTNLTPASIIPLNRTAAANACGADGQNSICFNQMDMGFTPGVLAFTRIVTADTIGESVGTSPPSAELGQILDADIYFNPNDSNATFATPSVLASNPKSYDLQSILTHELGHLLGFSHSPIWNAMMFPYAPNPGTFTGVRPSAQQPDAPLGDDDRTGMRVLYPDSTDMQHTGSIQGKIVPANALSLQGGPPGLTGLFGAHIVAIDSATGSVIAGTVGGWSCSGPGPATFDGSYVVEKLPVGHTYKIYAEPLNGAVSPSDVDNSMNTLCRNVTTDAGWPAEQGCVVPAINISFTTRIRPPD